MPGCVEASDNLTPVRQLTPSLPALALRPRHGRDYRAPLGHRALDEPVNLSIEIAEPQFELSPLGIHPGWETFPFIVISTHVLTNHAWMPQLGLHPARTALPLS
jgi:hypothetical protein